MEDILNEFNIDEEDVGEAVNVSQDPIGIKKTDFELLKIINILQEKGILNKIIVCEKCNKIIRLENNKNYIDKYFWRYRGKDPIHDIRTNIRINSIFENLKTPLNVIYYLTFHCFLKNMSIKNSLINITEFCKIMNIENVSNKQIIKLYRLLRNIIKKNYHLMWIREPLALEPAEQGYPCVEIDETSVIGNSSNVIWAFGIIDRSNKKARVFCIMNDRRKVTLSFDKEKC